MHRASLRLLCLFFGEVGGGGGGGHALLTGHGRRQKAEWKNGEWEEWEKRKASLFSVVKLQWLWWWRRQRWRRWCSSSVVVI